MTRHDCEIFVDLWSREDDEFAIQGVCEEDAASPSKGEMNSTFASGNGKRY